MSRNDLNIEDLFRTQMETYQVDPSPGLWQKVHSRILWKQFLGFSFQTFNVYYLAAVLSLAGLGIFALLSGPDIENPQTEVQSLAESDPGTPAPGSETTPHLQQKESEQQAEVTALKTQSANREVIASENKSSGNKSAEETKSMDQSPDKKNAPSLPAATEKSVKGLQGKKSESISVKADFSASQVEGCSPLAVNFTNTSENAEQAIWLFGDGGSTTEKSPSWVFDEPGEYSVTLKVSGTDEQIYLAHQIITVYESPKALFEMDENVDLSQNQPVFFYNYSRGADFYSWDFGDGEKSDLLEPIHYYNQSGSYDVKLIVWTGNQCYDSLIIHNAFTGPDGKIRFPNAFTPNMSGPSGGYYEINDISNTIFHPVVEGDLIEYQMKIFNRKGLQVFESNDVSIGWDGYYQEKLAGQDVYIWKARGKFSNGKTFVKSGDLTLVRQY